MKALLNIGMYQAIWFLCVLFGNIGALAGLLLIFIHLFITGSRKEDFWMGFILLCLGLVIDGVLAGIGFISFRISGFPIPFWLMIIWLGLAMTVNHSLAWMKRKPMIAMAFGAIGGPGAYWAGVRLGAATFQWDLLDSLVLLALLWGLLWTGIMRISVYVENDRKLIVGWW